MNQSEPYHLLLVDDEENILKALRRIFHRSKDIRISTATDPKEAARVLKTRPVDLVISDERMPDIAGHQFVRFIQEHYPDVLRMILTGYSDQEAMLKAVNEGQVYRYLTKPWDDAELLIIVRKALEHSRAERDRRRMAEILKSRNSQLLLELTAKKEELEKALHYITAQRDEARKGLQGTAAFLHCIAGLIQAEDSASINRVVDLVDLCLPALGLPGDEAEEVRMAAYLYRIGAFGGKEKKSLRETVKISAYLLTEVLQTPEIGGLVKSIFENWDGSGEPDGLRGEEIPLASRVVRLAHEFDTLVNKRGHDEEAALAVFNHQKGHHFDPRLTETFLEQREDQ